MSILSQLLVRLATNWFPILMVVTGMSILAIGVLVVRQLSKAKKAAGGEDAGPTAETEEEPRIEVIPPAALPSPRQIRRTVSQGFRTLRERVTNRELRYRTPCFLVLGTEGAGKTTVLHQLRPEAVSPIDVTEALGCRWNFFDRAVAIEVDGRLLRSEPQPGPSEKGWMALLRGLRFHRPERPIDGVILTVPAHDLFGAKHLDADALVLHARGLFERLQTAQKVLGVRIPLYLVVTKCDIIQGFQDFCMALPPEKRDESFGWANPYALEAAFVPEWMDEAFDSLGADLFEVQMELLARGGANSPDNVFHFSTGFRALQGPLRAFTTELCKASAYQESFFFRGIYFTGDGTPDPAEHLLDAQYVTAETTSAAASAAALPALPAKFAVSREPFFLRDLFSDKIFGETGLARSISNSRISRNRTIRAIQIAIITIIVGGGIGIWRADVVLDRESGLLLSVLNDIRTELEVLDLSTPMTGSDVVAARGAGLEDRVFPLLASMARINRGHLASFFLPSSWVSPLHWEISESLRLGFTNVILPAMYSAMLEKGDSLIASSTPTDSSVETIDGGAQKRYLSAVARYGRNLERYDTVAFVGAERTGLLNVSNLVLYLFDEQLPPEFLTDADYYRTALWESYSQRITPADRPTFSADVVARSEQILRDYYDSLIYRLEDINARFQSAERVQRLTSADLIEFRQLRDELTQVEQVLNGSQPFWFDTTQEIGPDLLVLLDSIPRTVLTSPDSIQDGFEEMFYRVRAEKLRELNYRLDPFQGSSGAVAGRDSTMTLSPQLALLQTSLDSLYTQPFIAGSGPTTPRPIIPAGSQIRWNVSALDRALLQHTQYQNFLAERQAADTPGMSRLMQGLATVQLESRIVSSVHEAMVPEPQGYSFGLRDRERDLRDRITSFQDPANRLVQILEITSDLGMTDAYEEVADLYLSQAMAMLEETDALLQEGGAYRPLGGSMLNWDGESPPIQAAFRARDAEALESYLTDQRTRIRYLVDNFAAPLLAGLLSEPMAPYLNGASSDVDTLIQKWQGLVSELDRYEAQSGTSSVEVLEQFIRDEMTSADIPTCLANRGRAVASGGDFFLSARNRLRTDFYNRCEQIGGARAEIAYKAIRDFFNRNLAGRYPFSRIAAEGPSSEADVPTLRQFYQLLDSIAPYRVAVSSPSAAEFLGRMDAVRAFLQPLLDPEAEPGSPAFAVSVTFRANREEEVGGDQIVNWTLGLGEAPIAYLGGSEEQSAVWRPGSPVSLSLRWALQSTQRPQASPYVGATVDDRVAAFSYGGRWALLRLLQDHIDEGPEGTRGYLLRFEVPTVERVGDAGAAPSVNAQLFVGLRLRYPDGGAPPLLPTFPVQAPEWGG